MSLAPIEVRGRWRAYAAFLVDHRRALWAFAIALSIASALLASKLPLKADFANLLPPDAPSVVQLHAIEKRTSVPNIYLIGVEGDDAVKRAAASELMRAELAKIPPSLADEVIYDDSGPRKFGWTNRFLFASLDDLESARDALDEKIQRQNPMFVPLFDDDDDKPATPSASASASTGAAAAPSKAPLDELRDKLADAKAHAEHPKLNISKDGRLQLILVRAGSGDTDDQLLDSINDAIALVRSKAGQGVSLGVTGGAVTGRAEQKALLDGMVRSTVVTLVLVLLAMAVFFRTILGVGALGTALIVGTLVTFGFTKLTVGQLNIASAFLSSIVIGNGINFGILLLARWLEEKRNGRVGVDALAVAMKGTAPGTIAAAVAAAVAYGSLVSTPFRGFRDFGIIGGVGMLLCWVSTYTLFPTLLYIVDKKIDASREPIVGRLLGRLVARNPWPVVTAGLVLFVGVSVVSFRFLTHDPFEQNLRNLGSESPELAESGRWMSKFDREFDSGLDGGFVIATEDRAQALQIATHLREIDAGKSDEKKIFSHVETIDDRVPKDQQKKLAVLAEIRNKLDRSALPRTKGKEHDDLLELRPPNDLRVITADDLPKALALAFTERDGTRGRLVLLNTGKATDTGNVPSLRNFAATVRALNLPKTVLIGGGAFVISDVVEAMLRDGPRATLMSAIGALLVVAFAVGWGRYAFVTVVCGALGTLSLLSIAHLIGLKVNFLDFVALPITIGIGIDYAVNIASRARQAGGSGRTAVETTGGAVLLCSYTTVVGYASLLFSANKGIRSFGESAMIGELTCITAALVFAPALIDAITRLLPSKSSQEISQ